MNLFGGSVCNFVSSVASAATTTNNTTKCYINDEGVKTDLCGSPSLMRCLFKTGILSRTHPDTIFGSGNGKHYVANKQMQVRGCSDI